MARKEKAEQYLKTPLNNEMLNYNVYAFSSLERLFVYIISFILGGITGLIFYGGLFKSGGYATFATYISDSIFFMAVGIGGIKFLVPLYRGSMLKKRKNKLQIQFRDMLQSLAASFSVGSNVQGAFTSALADLKMQYNEKDFIVKEMQQIIDGTKQGISLDTMLRDFAYRSQNDDIASFADVFEICFRTGGNLQSVVIRTFDIIGEKITISAEIQTKLTSNKMQHNVMSVMPIIMVLFLKLTNSSFAENFATFKGIFFNTVAIAIFIASYKYGQKIVDIKA